MGARYTPLIAVDISLLANESGGLTRYLRELLPALVRLSAGRCRWVLYGRDRSNVAPELLSAIDLREDRLPSDLGRVASLFTSMPYWAKQDMPDVFWGPAHRLPIWLPNSIKKVVTVHDLCWLLAPETMRPMTRVLDAFFMPRAVIQADRIIAVSNATRLDLVKQFPTLAHKVQVVHEGASPLPNPLPIEALVSWGLKQPYVLFVGTKEPRKNLARLLSAFAQVIRNKPPSTTSFYSPQLVLVGLGGWGKEIIAEEITRLKLGAHLHVLGRVTDEQLSTLYKYANCLVMPSLYEGFGLPLVEAMTHGTPVITSNVASMPEVAGAAGLLVNPLSVESIASAISCMLNKPGTRKYYSESAVHQATKFTWQQTALETLECLLN